MTDSNQSVEQHIKKNRFALVVTLLCCLNYSVKANITVTTVNQTINHYVVAGYEIDLDADGVNDFHFRVFEAGPYKHTIVKGLHSGAETVRLMAATIYAVDDLAYGEGFGTQWGADTTYLYHNAEFSDMEYKGPRYIPLRLENGGSYNYGWIQVEVAMFGQALTLVEYGFQDEKNKQLTAGEENDFTGLVETGKTKRLNVYPTLASDVLHIQFDQSFGSVLFASIYDLNGNLVCNNRLQRGDLLNIEMLPSGNYLLRVVDKKTAYSSYFTKH